MGTMARAILQGETMAFQTITTPEISTGAPIDFALLGKVKGNLDEHETELTVLQTATPLVVVGTIVHSVLTLAQYQSLAGPGWVLAEGQSIIGSTLHSLTGMTNAPDARGRVLRGKNNGASGANYNPSELNLGEFQNQGTAKNGLSLSDPGHNHSIPTWFSENGSSGSYAPNVQGYGGAGPYGSAPTSSSGTGVTLGAGDNETRMKNITTNIFIKIN